MKTQKYKGLMDVSKDTGIPFWRIIYAEQAGYIPEPMRIACKRVYMKNDVQKIKEHFAKKEDR